MFMQAYKAALRTILKKPFMLWGLSLLSGIICTIATVAAGILSVIGIAFAFVVAVGMSKVYLDGLEGKEVNSDQLFSGFNKRIFRIAGGMAWRQLWIIIWSLAVVGIPVAIFALFSILAMIPFIGFIFLYIGGFIAILSVIPVSIYYISKIYSYAFVPYILATKPDVTATGALRLSMEMTNGKKSQMWLADFLYGVIVFFVTFILALLTNIPFIGFIFGIVLFAWTLALIFFGSLFKGLYAAEFYRLKPMPKAPKMMMPPYNGHPYNGVPYNGVPYNGQPQQNHIPQQGYVPQHNFNPQQNYVPQQNFNPQAAPAQQNFVSPNNPGQGSNPTNNQ